MALARVINVLIVDDVPQVCSQIELFFESRNEMQSDYEFRVEKRHSISECVELLRSDQHYDVLILDVIFPEEGDKHGMEVALLAQCHLGPTIPIRIVMTAHPDFADCCAAGRAGVWAYLHKVSTNKGKSFAEAVVDSALYGLRHNDFQKEIVGIIDPWLRERGADLEKEHAGQVVALWHTPDVHVVASGRDQFEVARALLDWKDAAAAPWQHPLIYPVPRSGGPSTLEAP
jgi:CheY-like chemotaxis protein